MGSNPLLGFCVCVVLCRSRHFDGSVCRPGFYKTIYIQEAGHAACMKININVNKTFFFQFFTVHIVNIHNNHQHMHTSSFDTIKL